MKIFETKIMCMKEKEITANSSKGYPSKIYPNSGIEGYHDFFEFEYFTEGNGVHYINGIPFEVKKSYAYFLLPGDSHHKILDEEVQYNLYNLKLDVNAPDKNLIKELKEYKSPLCIYFDDSDSEIIENEFKFLIKVLNTKLYNQRMVKNISERILNIFLCALENGQKADADTNTIGEKIWEIIKYIENNYSKNISLESIAELTEISENYIGTYFKKHTGLTFVNYLNSKRLSQAATLLKETNLSIKEIAFSVGYSSPEYFTRLFTSAFSITPKEYRKENKL